jgi:hypothetical protein
MQRSLSVVALVAIVLASAHWAAASSDIANCTTVTSPMDYYRPPAACVSESSAIESCVENYNLCAGNASACGDLMVCFRQRGACLNNVQMPANTSQCASWYEGLNNAELYISAGGMFNGSALQDACAVAACALNNATQSLSCQVNITEACGAPSQELIKYVLTFGGSYPADILTNTTRRKAVERLITRGLSRILSVLEYLIQILALRFGSLIVEFAVNSAGVTGAPSAQEIQNRLATAAQDPSILAGAFAELRAETGVDVVITAIAVTGLPSGETAVPISGLPTEEPDTTTAGSGSTPAPGSTTDAPGASTPAPSGASVPAVVAAVAAVAAALLL